MTVSGNIGLDSLGGKACLHEAGAGTADRPMAANAGSTPAPLVHTRSHTVSAPISTGIDAHPPQDICHMLGELSLGDGLTIPHLIGAVMSLCRTVEQQAAEIAALRAGVTADVRSDETSHG